MAASSASKAINSKSIPILLRRHLLPHPPAAATALTRVIQSPFPLQSEKDPNATDRSLDVRDSKTLDLVRNTQWPLRMYGTRIEAARGGISKDDVEYDDDDDDDDDGDFDIVDALDDADDDDELFDQDDDDDEENENDDDDVGRGRHRK